MKRYETITIIDPDLSDDGRKPILERIGGLISDKNGTDIRVDEWGSRRLAYDIKKKSRGYYIRFDYCGDGPLVDEIERSCRIDDRVLKYMTVLTDDSADPDEIQKEIDEEREKAEAAKVEAADPPEATDDTEAADDIEATDDTEAKDDIEAADDAITAEPETKAPETEPEAAETEGDVSEAKEEPNA